jgi:glucosamine-6-phosphate deaminase
MGENGHLAFNDPPVADFRDPRLVKVVELDPACRRQQVHDGAFAELEAVPRRAITLTIPAITGAPHLVATVPGAAKAQAVRDALLGPVAPSCPASVLREHRDAVLFLDREAAALLPGPDAPVR